MAVYLIKMDVVGEKDVAANSGKKKEGFESANKLISSDVVNIQFKYDQLNSVASQRLTDKGFCVRSSIGTALEVSKERLLELAESARTRDEIEAEKEPDRVL